MKKLCLFITIALVTLGSCSKEALNSSDNEVSLSSSGSENRAYKWVDIQETYPLQWSDWNPCTGELINFSGTAHFKVQGLVNKNGFNYTLHYNVSNTIGIGQTTGIVYRTKDNFNYHNKGNFTNGQAVWQQTGIIKYTSTGKEPNLFSEDSWHLTINANGEVTTFRTTSGRIISCR